MSLSSSSYRTLSAARSPQDGSLQPWWLKFWVAALGLLTASLLWNWALTLAIVVALMAGVLVYLRCVNRLYIRWLAHNTLWKSHRPLWIALLTGTAVFFLTYLIIQVWQESTASWFAAGVILQGIGTLSILALVFWQYFRPYREGRSPLRKSQASFIPPLSDQRLNQLFSDLSHSSSLQRLLAVRQLAQWAQASKLQQSLSASTFNSPQPAWTPADVPPCFQLMLKQESEPIVQQALKTSLVQLTQAEPKRGTSATVQPAPPPSVAVSGGSLPRKQCVSEKPRSSRIGTQRPKPSLASLRIPQLIRSR